MSDSGRHRSPVAPGEVVGGKYRVERVLGAGGMGVVVEATHLDLGQPVALKFIQGSALTSPAAVERFMREARAAVRLRSEHVCRVLDVGRDTESRPYMVLELLEGMDLAKVAKLHGPLPVADAVEYVLQACDALVEAHALGIVHRDLKPQNIFVTRRVNGTPLVKVLDFGIAKTVGGAAAGQMALTDSSAIIGSPLYMAPEQMRAPKTVDVRIDIWALGVILYELIGGQLPFDGETVTQVCIKVVNDEPTRLLDLRPGLDRKLVDVVMRCLEKDPEDRWPNVAQLAVELEPFSRSGRQGSFARPWRSFEDTQESTGAPRVVVPAPHGSSPDETGPSTAITMPSVPGVDAALVGASDARAHAATTPLPGALLASASLGAPPAASSSAPGPVSLEPASPLASTDTTWGDGTTRRPPAGRRSRSGVLVPVVAVAVAAAAAVFALRAAAPVTTAAPVSARPVVTAVEDPPVAPTAPPVVAQPTPDPEPAEVTPPEDPKRTPSPETTSTARTTAAPRGVMWRPPLRAGKREPPPEPASAAAAKGPETSPPAEAPRTSEPKPAETTVRNGAPIIR